MSKRDRSDDTYESWEVVSNILLPRAFNIEKRTLDMEKRTFHVKDTLSFQKSVKFELKRSITSNHLLHVVTCNKLFEEMVMEWALLYSPLCIRVAHYFLEFFIEKFKAFASEFPKNLGDMFPVFTTVFIDNLILLFN